MSTQTRGSPTASSALRRSRLLTRRGICLTYGYAIEGDQLSIEIIDYGCPATGEAPLLDRIGLTVLFETSPFTRQP